TRSRSWTRSRCRRPRPSSRCRASRPPAPSRPSPRKPAMFDDPRDVLWLIPALPLAASVLTAFLGPAVLRRHSHWPCIVRAVPSSLLSSVVLGAVRGLPLPDEGRRRQVVDASGPGGDHVIHTYYTWFAFGEVDVGFTLRADGLTAIMLVTVTFVGSLIAIYSAGYMHGDPGYARYFAEIALVLFAMTGLVVADNFSPLYAFWEGVGLCSYLLIGFWFTRPSAADAARKAFLVTRLGDVGFFIGILLLWSSLGYNLQFDRVFTAAAAQDE